jgi:hypothetical protein
MIPKIVRPFSSSTFQDLVKHITEIRRIFEGTPWHDVNEPEENRFNRYWWHNLPLLVKLHNSEELIALASEVFGEPVKPSYVFLSMYGPDGVCPRHTDRPQCKYTIDLQISSDGAWPIYVDEKPYILKDGEALAYSGTDQPHFRNAMQREPGTTFVNLAFFHFVPVGFTGELK